MENKNVKFNSNHLTLMWISTKGLSFEEEENVLKVIENYDDKNLTFKGHCFGRFDLIVEFSDEVSAKVASNKICELQERIVNELGENLGHASICSALTLGKRLLPINEDYTPNSIENPPIIVYTFLKPKTEEINLWEVFQSIEELNKEHKETYLEIYWTASAYTFLLKVCGYQFNKIFSRIMEFREKTKNYFSESSTYVCIGWRANNEKESETEIKASVFVKLKRGYGDLELDKEKDKSFNSMIIEKRKRLGWSDLSYEVKTRKLIDLKEAILDLRKNHREEIINTSTLIYPQWGGD